MKKTHLLLACLASLVMGLSACEPTISSSIPSSSSSSSQNEEPSFDVNSNLTVEIDQTATIEISNMVNLVKEDFEFSSYNTNVATVDNNGVVKGVSEGTTQILIKAKTIRKTVDVTVTDSNKLNDLVSLKKIKNIAALDSDNSSIDYTGAPLYNIAWDGGTYESTQGKFDFDNMASDDEVILRGAHVSDTASIDNGDYVIVMSNGGDSNLTSDNVTDDVQAMVYSKVLVSEWANSFRLWGWASKNDQEQAPASGVGRFRVAAYEFNEDYTSYNSYYLTASDIGTLTQDENGWITFDDVSDTLNGTISGAPADNMFIFEVNNDDYDLRNKEILLSIETANYANTKGENNTNMPNRFGIKRMGFMCDPKPDISLVSDAEVTLYGGQTSQIEVSGVGAASEGSFTFTSSNNDVATVDNNGLITAKEVSKEETATITITNSVAVGKEKTVTVHVLPIPEESFDVPSTVTLKVGETYKINPTNVVGDHTFTYSSSSNSIATVDEQGNVLANNVGNVEINVTFGTLTKKILLSINETEQIVGISNDIVKNMASFNDAGMIPGAWDFAWSSPATTNGKAVIGDESLDQALVRAIKVSSGSDSQVNLLPNDIEFISNIGGVRDDLLVGQVFVKANIPSNANVFRSWVRAGEPSADICNSTKTRVVVYLPNEDFTSYSAYPLSYLNSGDTHPSDSIKNDNVTNILELSSNRADGFLVYEVPEEIKGKENAIICIEAYSTNSELQTRQYIRRFGFME